ncbi:MAG: GGDEF domain-containing protein [Myxococcota bacterium]|nr:GGDEF domain-containing protein [Myxococcota bacterium]
MLRIVPNNRRQALRFRRSLTATAGYVFIAIGTIIAAYNGFVRGNDILWVWIFFAVWLFTSICILAAISTGFNKRFKDPSLTVFQLLVAIGFTTAGCFFIASSIRGIGIVVYVLIFVFGTFRLGVREYLFLLVLTVLGYILAMTLLYRTDPAGISPKLEAIRVVLLLLSLLWVSYMANYIANLRQRIKRMASHDHLTDIYNRREILRLLDREKSLSDRSGTTFSLCVIDIDDFKILNDTYGHQAGDQILKAFAEAIKHNIRSEDYVARYGGEEFLVVFVNYDCTTACSSNIQRLLTVTKALAFPDISPDLTVTISIGASSYQVSESIDSLIARADEALYRAKAAGKNRIEYQ